MSDTILYQNAFSIFGLPVQYDICTATLEKNYISLQKQWHPDRFIHAPEIQKEQVVQATAHINAAYKTLKDPLTRAQLLLDLSLPHQTPTPSPSVLSQQFELQEKWEHLDKTNAEIFKTEIITAFEQEIVNFQQEIMAKNKEAFQSFFTLKFLHNLLIKITHL